MNRAVDVALGSEMHHGTWLVLAEQRSHELAVSDVALHETMPDVAFYPGQICQIAGVGQLVEIDDGGLLGCHPLQHKIGADESGAAGHDNGVRAHRQALREGWDFFRRMLTCCTATPV